MRNVISNTAVWTISTLDIDILINLLHSIFQFSFVTTDNSDLSLTFHFQILSTIDLIELKFYTKIAFEIVWKHRSHKTHFLSAPVSTWGIIKLDLTQSCSNRYICIWDFFSFVHHKFYCDISRTVDFDAFSKFNICWVGTTSWALYFLWR